MIGEERAVGELWDAAARAACPRRARTGPGQPVYVLDEPPEPGETGLREATLGDLDLLVPACAAAHEEEIGHRPARARPRRLPLADAGADRRGALVDLARGAARSSSRPRRRPGRRSAVQLQQVWVDPAARGRGYAQRGMRDLCRRLLERRAARVPVRPPGERARRSALYEAIGMRRTISLPQPDLLKRLLEARRGRVRCVPLGGDRRRPSAPGRGCRGRTHGVGVAATDMARGLTVGYARENAVERGG